MRLLLLLERGPVSLEPFPSLLERVQHSLERFLSLLERVYDSLERFPLLLERIQHSLEHFPLLLERVQHSLERFLSLLERLHSFRSTWPCFSSGDFLSNEDYFFIHLKEYKKAVQNCFILYCFYYYDLFFIPFNNWATLVSSACTGFSSTSDSFFLGFVRKFQPKRLIVISIKNSSIPARRSHVAIF